MSDYIHFLLHFVSGVDEHTALLLNVTSGLVQLEGVGYAFVCSFGYDEETIVCRDGQPLTVKGMHTYTVLHGIISS